MKKIISIVMFILILSLAACSSDNGGKKDNSSTDEANFPERQIRYIVPYKTGGSSDITARIIEDIIRKNNLLDHPLVTTNIDGASTGEGLTTVRDADSDGHTLLHHDTSMIAHELTGVRDWGFRTFTPVAQLFELPGAIITTPGKYSSFEEWIEDVKSNPNQTSFAVSSIGGSSYLFGEQVLLDLGLSDKINTVSYGSGSDLNAAILAGENNAAAGPLAQHIQAHFNGDQQILAVATPERLPSLPDVPTFKELGIDLTMSITHRMGVWAPPETPENIVKELQNLFEQVIESDEFMEQAERLGFSPAYGNHEVLISEFEKDEQTLKEIIDRLDLDIE